MTRSSASGILASSRRIVADVGVVSSIYSAFGYYGARRAYQLPGRWLVTALGDLGFPEMTVRQALFRMVRSGELTTRMQGRNKFYRPAPEATPEVHAASDRMHRADWSRWDGQWTIVYLTATVGQGNERERLHDFLYDEGFAWIGPGVFLHPRDRVASITAGARNLDLAHGIEMFRARRVASDHREFAARHWDLAGLHKQYEHFIREYAALESAAPGLPDRVAFVLRFALAFEFLKIAWRDPELPSRLLPAQWSGGRAQELVLALDQALLPAATAHADALMAATRAR